MKLEIKKIRLNELDSFVQSETYNRFLNVPITPERAKSFIHNPHAKPDDVVLFLGFVEGKLVAFRSLFAGIVTTKNEQIRFGWCSGNRVHPDFRRNGFSEQLLKEAHSDWNGKLMFTNYAPSSENLYLKTGWFQSIYEFAGVRGYLFPKTRKLLPAANKNMGLKLLFSVIDFFIAVVSTIRLWFFDSENNPDYRLETIQFPDEQCFESIQKNNSTFVFNRNANELKWIFQYPWISKIESTISKKYPFSSYSSSFIYQTVKIFNKNNFAGFFIFSVKEGHLKTLYFNVPSGIENKVANYLKQFCIKHKIELVTVYKTEIALQFFAQKFPFLHTKKYGQKIYSSFEINVEKKYQFQDGDGDVIFT